MYKGPNPDQMGLRVGQSRTMADTKVLEGKSLDGPERARWSGGLGAGMWDR